MALEKPPEKHRFCLPPGTVVEGWRILGCHGHGAHGVVYRAVRVGRQASGIVALKLALYPWDPRFMREVALLSLIHHPSVPRLLAHGFWKHPAGTVHPFIVMEWIEGMPLYEWAREHRPSTRQVLEVLAQLAGALQATHASSAVHRDVKGDNVLVSPRDGRAVLTDFGSGCYQAAARLTWQPLPPGTPAYQSPESGLFQIRSVSLPNAHYQAAPADDVYALGVTAYRLVTGAYPPSPSPELAEDGSWRLIQPASTDPRVLNPEVQPELSALIQRMLSLSPEARGSAAELAEAFEAARPRAGQERSASRAERAKPRAWSPTWSPGRVLALAGVLLALSAGVAMHLRRQGASSGAPRPEQSSGTNTPAVSLGEQTPAAPVKPEQQPSKSKAIGQGQPPLPVPGQVRPDAKGRCPGSKQVPINGGCWFEILPANAEECEQNGSVFFKGRCYSPALEPPLKPPPTSAPPQ